MLSIVSLVHLGHRRPCDKLAVPRAPCTSARRGHTLHVDLISRLGRAGLDSVPGWTGLPGRSGSGHCGAQLNSRVFHFLFDLF
jgi:hypothetical protein